MGALPVVLSRTLMACVLSFMGALPVVLSRTLMACVTEGGFTTTSLSFCLQDMRFATNCNTTYNFQVGNKLIDVS